MAYRHIDVLSARGLTDRHFREIGRWNDARIEFNPHQLLPFGGRERFLEFLRQRVGNDADLGDLARQVLAAGAYGDGIADPETIEAGDGEPRRHEAMLTHDLDHWFPRSHHRPGADQDFAD